MQSKEQITNDQKSEDENKEMFVVKTEGHGGKSAKRVTTEEIRQGHTGDHVRYILIASLTAAVFCMIVIAVLFA